MRKDSFFWISLAIVLLLVSSCVPQNPSIDQKLIDELLKQIEELNLTNNTEESVFKEVTAQEGDKITLLPLLKPADSKVKYHFSPPFDENGTWQTKKGDAGVYLVKVTISNGENQVSKNILVKVLRKNHAPELIVNDTIYVKENTTLKLNFTAYDLDNDSLNITISGWMNSTSKFIGFDSQGEHFVKITVSDGITSISKDITILVLNVNRKPVINISSKNVKVNEQVKFTDSDIFDLDNEKIKISPETLIFNSEGNFSKLITVCDKETCVNKTITFIVYGKNLPPEIDVANELTAYEGETFCLPVSYKDPENDSVTIVYSGWMNTKCKKIGYNESGTHIVNILASDGINQVKKEVHVFVKDVNKAPIIKDIIIIKE